MGSLLDAIMERNKGLVKEAFIGALVGAAARAGTSMLTRAGTWMIKNPMKTLNVGLPAYEGASAARNAFTAKAPPTPPMMHTGPTI